MTASGKAALPDSPYAVFRLLVALALITLGSSGMYVIAVVLPSVQADFGIDRAQASMPYTLMTIGFGLGGMAMGWLADRHGVRVPLLIGAVGVGLGYGLSAMTENIWVFTLIHGIFIGFLGCAASFAPLIADTSLWFVRRRGIAVAVCASGNYLSGAIWPPLVQHFIYEIGWRQTYLYLGLFSFAAMAALSLLMHRRSPSHPLPSGAAARGAAPTPPKRHLTGLSPDRPFGFSPARAQLLLCVAGVGCCVAMAMPQVHIVAYCSDLGYGPARGAEMLSLMLLCGIVSRLVSGAICDHIGGLRTLLLGSVLQTVALFLFLPFDGLVPLYAISALFGLFQGGIVPAYAIVVREYFRPEEAGARTGTVLMATLLGMALGAWSSGKIYDLTGSYQAAFANGVAWNVLNVLIVGFLLWRTMRPRGARGAAASSA